jgi:hypothetical protein
MVGRKRRRYECRFLDKENRQGASVWMERPDDTVAIAEAAIAAGIYRTEQMARYVLRRRFRKIVCVEW